MLDGEIDDLCKKHSCLCQFWDGAFSFARKLDWTDGDIALSFDFVSDCHADVGCNITSKVHLLLKHVTKND